jgi:hypothetical protein
MTLARIPSMLDTDLVVSGGPEYRIHPKDLRELRESRRFCWPNNAPSDVFYGVKLIADDSAERLPRKAL